MNELHDTYRLLLVVYAVFSPLCFCISLAGSGWYGRLAPGWSRPYALPGRWAWFAGEIISPIALLYGASGRQLDAPFLTTNTYASSGHSADRNAWLASVLLALWLIHYTNRAVIHPLRVPRMSPMPAWTLAAMMIFNVMNGWVNGYWISLYAASTGQALLRAGLAGKLKFAVGLGMFVAGGLVNYYADSHLFQLKRASLKDRPSKEHPGRYRIPYSRLFSLVSCPHYLGEIVEWCGWAVMTSGAPGYLFALATMANLVPRALSIHAWYHRTFSDYPSRRRAIFPWLL
ncbi:3-oxo-5-alpha-steroid 4-dehydrogenase-domain-containing protein [Thamnocephalis sphaerospora]|uniref:3-oxo-5-alpha-steroid 4-dehydrogenase-domain-containing protein n=1 Tax=Thamnocephalis sphaerospora TaxID=78915 RepID=A0A4P9XU89_9FUNG|nr:3-oxo-5-alpha-steroid 4-dehydrogenase-domain-containing protein [Thamnocephalis sphaerospora]|eukprot:RKP09512.1 3-oxo-5-alpha-steroid 4-dehydrogenase-domain-containing protein [Thamnocephalis sphaerospora]